MTLHLTPGGEVSTFVDLKREAGIADTVQMTFGSLPAGFTQEGTRGAADSDCSVRLDAAENVAPGTYTLTPVGTTDAGVQTAARSPQATDGDGRASVDGLGVGSGPRPGLTADAQGRGPPAGTNGAGLAVARLNANGPPDLSVRGNGQTAVPVTGQDGGTAPAVSGGTLTSPAP
ncbi:MULTISPECIES: hypothetical protein [Deinococcus]|uniref:Uncharacterized protein n=1 Tax=Deinococcus rufus TaxID=2136097 RepID=A0ABV7Z8G1_9DEIO|nr:hypothetical protein [Deinococcus sp. AB2017081]WQE97308.1 hypothetical protein U2P90_19575 [Deinococcus sp. AB2017081]